MPDYTVFGGCLRSDKLPFPELPFSDSEVPNWFLRVADNPYNREVGHIVGVGTEPECQVVLYRIANGFRLHHSCTGDFEITANGAEIAWYPCIGAKPEMARCDVLGRVLSVALHMAGILNLHGSAVAFEHDAVAFLAPKGYGKSTLAAALLLSGARLITDDTVAVEPGPPAVIRPGVHSLRLCSDSAGMLVAPEMPRDAGVDGKCVVNHMSSELAMLSHARLSAIYLLQPVLRELEGLTARRRRLSASQAVISLLAHVKVGQLLRKSEASAVFDRAVTLAHSVPVYALEVLRDLDKMDATVDIIAGWHSALAPAEA